MKNRILFGLTLGFFLGNFASANVVIPISGTKLMLTGSTSTTLDAREKGTIYTLGWVLIVLGSLSGGHDSKGATSTDIVLGSSEEIWKSMKRDCRIAQVNPFVAAAAPIGSAIQSMDYLQGLDDGQKVVQFCSLLFKIDHRASELRASIGAEYSEKLGSEVVEGDLSPSDFKAIQNMFALAGVI